MSCTILSELYRHSEGNLEVLNELSEENKRKSNYLHDHNPHEISNFLNEGEQILEKLISAKNHAWRLDNKVIDENFQDLERLLKNQIYNLRVKHFTNSTSDQKNEASQELSLAHDRINALLMPLYEQLREDLLFKKN